MKLDNRTVFIVLYCVVSYARHDECRRWSSVCRSRVWRHGHLAVGVIDDVTTCETDRAFHDKHTYAFGANKSRRISHSVDKRWLTFWRTAYTVRHTSF